MVEMAGSASCYPRPIEGMPLGFSSTSWTRCYSPTSATDLRHVHPKSVRFSSVWLSPRQPPLRVTATMSQQLSRRWRRLTLRQNQPRMDARLTPRIELRPRPSTALPHFWRKCRAPLRAMLPLPQRCRLWAGLAASASDALCRASRPSGNPNAYGEPEPTSTVRASTRPAFPAQSVFHRQVLPRSALADAFFGNPPPIPRFCHLRFGFRRLFASVKALAPGS